MTLSDYKTLVVAEADDTSTRAGAVVERAIKDVYQEVIRYCLEGLVATTTEDTVATAGTAEYTPTAFVDIKAVLWKPTTTDNYTRLTEVNQEEYFDDYINQDSSTPVKYFRNGNKIQLLPAPDEAGTMRVVYWPVQTELMGAQVSIIPDRFTNVIMLGSLARFMAYERVPDADNYKADYQQALAEMIRELGCRGEIIKPKIYG